MIVASVEQLLNKNLGVVFSFYSRYIRLIQGGGVQGTSAQKPLSITQNYRRGGVMKIKTLCTILMVLLLVGCPQVVRIDSGQGDNGEDITTDIPDSGNKAITISGPKVVDIDFAEGVYASSPTGLYGDYAKIELTASSTGETAVDLTGATWSWQAMDSGAEVSIPSTANATATYKGINPGTIEVSITATDGTTASYEVEVVESTFFTFDLSTVTATADGYRLELPLVHEKQGNYFFRENWEYTVDWGDGSKPEILVAEDYDCDANSYPEHYYAEAKEYTVRILNSNDSIGLQSWNFGIASSDRVLGTGDGTRLASEYSATELVDVKRYGSGKMALGMFAYCDKITHFSASGSPQLGDNMYKMFFGAKNFDQDISNWNVSGVKNMSGLFQGAEAYTNGGVALTWGEKTASVEYMRRMFYGAKNFNQNINGWNVSSVIDMQGMFSGAILFTNKNVQLDWDLSDAVTAKNDAYSHSAGHNVSSMWNMFSNGSGLSSLVSLHPDGCLCDVSGHKLP